MTLLETSLGLLFMAMFFVALMAASSGLERLTRGYTCRVLSSDPQARSPQLGCTGQTDEVSVHTVGLLSIANQSALRALRDDLLRVGVTNVSSTLAISLADLQPSTLLTRRSLQDRCLWEKATPLNDGRVAFARNYLRISGGSSPSLSLATASKATPLPAPEKRTESDHYWFIRGGRLIGERITSIPNAQPEVEPVAGMQAVEDGLLSVAADDDPSAAISVQERDAETSGLSDPLEQAPNRQWGIINQVCLFQSSQLPTLFMLSADRGSDLGRRKGPFFGQEVGLASRQPQPRLVFAF
jgi:hypothetical protein